MNGGVASGLGVERAIAADRFDFGRTPAGAGPASFGGTTGTTVLLANAGGLACVTLWSDVSDSAFGLDGNQNWWSLIRTETRASTRTIRAMNIRRRCCCSKAACDLVSPGSVRLFCSSIGVAPTPAPAELGT